MGEKASTPEQYLAALPAERKAVIEAVRAVIKQNLDAGFEEGIQYGMLGYYVPHRLFKDGYHADPKQPLPFAALAAQKNYYSLYLMGLYVDSPDGSKEGKLGLAFRAAWEKTGKKLDMGKACVRFKKLDDLPLDVIGKTFASLTAKRYIELYQASRSQKK